MIVVMLDDDVDTICCAQALTHPEWGSQEKRVVAFNPDLKKSILAHATNPPKQTTESEKKQLACITALDCLKQLDTPTTLTFLGHSDNKEYGKFKSAKNFVAELCKQVKNIHALEKINLVGCEVGFTVNGTSFAQQVADELKKQVPNKLIKVHAVFYESQTEDYKKSPDSMYVEVINKAHAMDQKEEHLGFVEAYYFDERLTKKATELNVKEKNTKKKEFDKLKSNSIHIFNNKNASPLAPKKVLGHAINTFYPHEQLVDHIQRAEFENQILAQYLRLIYAGLLDKQISHKRKTIKINRIELQGATESKNKSKIKTLQKDLANREADLKHLIEIDDCFRENILKLEVCEKFLEDKIKLMEKDIEENGGTLRFSKTYKTLKKCQEKFPALRESANSILKQLKHNPMLQDTNNVTQHNVKDEKENHKIKPLKKDSITQNSDEDNDEANESKNFIQNAGDQLTGIGNKIKGILGFTKAEDASDSSRTPTPTNDSDSEVKEPLIHPNRKASTSQITQQLIESKETQPTTNENILQTALHQIKDAFTDAINIIHPKKNETEEKHKEDKDNVDANSGITNSQIGSSNNLILAFTQGKPNLNLNTTAVAPNSTITNVTPRQLTPRQKEIAKNYPPEKFSLAIKKAIDKLDMEIEEMKLLCGLLFRPFARYELATKEIKLAALQDLFNICTKAGASYFDLRDKAIALAGNDRVMRSFRSSRTADIINAIENPTPHNKIILLGIGQDSAIKSNRKPQA